VSKLLDAMELSQYKDTFAKEQVSGEILLECDDQILEEDLKVPSRLHRIRLLKIISGKTPALQILNESRYVVFSK